MNADPYAPPSAALNTPTPAELAGGMLHTCGFWRRIGAALLDILMLSPLFITDVMLRGQSRWFELVVMLPAEVLVTCIYVYLTYRFGGTPGKMLMGMRVTMVDGAPVTLKAAMVRYAIGMAMALWLHFYSITAAMGMSDEAYKAMDAVERLAAISAVSPTMWLAETVFWVWLVVSFIMLIVHKQRRTVHDLIARTVVLHKR